MPVPKAIFEQIAKLIPPLNGTLHKGQAGRVGVLGGALDYTGAPFFAAFSAMRFGVDLSHVICSPTAAGAIKSYSPDLIVHPILRNDSSHEQVRPELDSLLSRLHVLVIGPGLGRESYMQSFAKLALELAKARGMYVVLDADALYMIGKDISVIRGYRRAVLTPNVVEFKRLCDQLSVDEGNDRALKVSRALGGITVLEKGKNDVVAVDSTGEEADEQLSKVEVGEKAKESVVVDVEGGLKRCGGQGDILSGNVAAVMAWGKCYETGAFGDGTVKPSEIPVLASVAGSIVTRVTSRRAFGKHGRGVVTQDMLAEIGPAFAEVFGEDSQGSGKNKL